jgi:hypothetical protein
LGSPKYLDYIDELIDCYILKKKAQLIADASKLQVVGQLVCPELQATELVRKKWAACFFKHTVQIKGAVVSER